MRVPLKAMNDEDIRDALRIELREEYEAVPDTAVIDELAIAGGRNRIDLALVNGVLHGFELKSDCDNLCRLVDQVRGYGAVCDSATLVVGERHLRRAIDLVPDWWGILVVRRDKRRPMFRSLKHSQMNPSVDPFAVARLLRRSEAADFLRELGYGNPDCRVPRRQLCNFIAENVDLSLLRQCIRDCIRERQSALRPRSCGD